MPIKKCPHPIYKNAHKKMSTSYIKNPTHFNLKNLHSFQYYRMASNNNSNHPPLRNLNKTIPSKRIKQLTQKIIFEIKQTSPNSLNSTERNFEFDKIPRHIAKAFLGEITPQDCSTIAALATLNILSFQFIELILYAIDGCMLNNLTTNSFLEKSIFDCITIHLLKMETPSANTLNIFSWNINKNKMMPIHGISSNTPATPDTAGTLNTSISQTTNATNTPKPPPTPKSKNKKNKKNKKNPIRRKHKYRTLYRKTLDVDITHPTTPKETTSTTTTTTTTTSTTNTNTKTPKLHIYPTPIEADADTTLQLPTDTTLQLPTYIPTTSITAADFSTDFSTATTTPPPTSTPLPTNTIATPPPVIPLQKQELNISDIIDLTSDVDSIPDDTIDIDILNAIHIDTQNAIQHDNVNNPNISLNGIESDEKSDEENNPTGTGTQRPSWQLNCGSYSSNESWRNASNNENILDFYDTDVDKQNEAEAEFNLDLSIEKNLNTLNTINTTQLSQISDVIHKTETNLLDLIINQHNEQLLEDSP